MSEFICVRVPLSWLPNRIIYCLHSRLFEIKTSRKLKKWFFWRKKKTYTEDIAKNGVFDTESNIRPKASLIAIDFTLCTLLKKEKKQRKNLWKLQILMNKNKNNLELFWVIRNFVYVSDNYKAGKFWCLNRCYLDFQLPSSSSPTFCLCSFALTLIMNICVRAIVSKLNISKNDPSNFPND